MKGIPNIKVNKVATWKFQLNHKQIAQNNNNKKWDEP